MTSAQVLAIILAAIWGAMWAAFIQLNYHGRFLAARLTWLSVVIGVGVDTIILLLIIPLEIWIIVMAVISASALPIIARSLLNESRDARLYHQLKHERNQSPDSKAHPKQDALDS